MLRSSIEAVKTALTRNICRLGSFVYRESLIYKGSRNEKSNIFQFSLLLFSPKIFWPRFERRKKQVETYTERYRSGHNGADSKTFGLLGTLRSKNPWILWVFWGLKTQYFRLFSPPFLSFFRSIGEAKIPWSGIEVVITRTTRNRGRYPAAPWPETLDFTGFFGYL